MRWIVGLVLVVACGRSGRDAAPSDGDAIPDGAAACSEVPAEASGEGTYYDADGTGSCSFDADPSRMVAALNRPDYGAAAMHCGACVEVTGPRGSVVVRVVDSCPGCGSGDLDLSREAFALIAPIAAGRVAISWHEVACDVRGPLRYRFKDGSNPDWTALQVRNHRYPIASLAARVADGSWRDLPRLDYNYFVDVRGLGDGPYTLRVSDQRGHVLEDDGIALGDAVERTGAAQLPTCR